MLTKAIRQQAASPSVAIVRKASVKEKVRLNRPWTVNEKKGQKVGKCVYASKYSPYQGNLYIVVLEEIDIWLGVLPPDGPVH